LCSHTSHSPPHTAALLEAADISFGFNNIEDLEQYLDAQGSESEGELV
jgi:hypothetical protein